MCLKKQYFSIDQRHDMLIFNASPKHFFFHANHIIQIRDDDRQHTVIIKITFSSSGHLCARKGTCVAKCSKKRGEVKKVYTRSN